MKDGRLTTKNGMSFVIKLWLEPREMAGDPQWRWHVHHVQSGEEASFTRLADVLRYVEDKACVAPPQ